MDGARAAAWDTYQGSPGHSLGAGSHVGGLGRTEVPLGGG